MKKDQNAKFRGLQFRDLVFVISMIVTVLYLFGFDSLTARLNAGLFLGFMVFIGFKGLFDSIKKKIFGIDGVIYVPYSLFPKVKSACIGCVIWILLCTAAFQCVLSPEFVPGTVCMWLLVALVIAVCAVGGAKTIRRNQEKKEERE